MPIKDGKYNRITWDCTCDCGGITTVRANALKGGLTQSCGCLAKENSNGNTCPLRKNICEICNKEFEFKSPLIQKTCSNECHNIRRSKYFKELHVSKRGELEYFISSLFQRCKTRSRNLKLDFNLDINYLNQLLVLQKFQCKITNIAFEMSSGDGLKGRSPWSPSLDRIDSNKGYTQDNVQFVCLMYNLCKSTWAHNDVVVFANSIKDF